MGATVERGHSLHILMADVEYGLFWVAHSSCWMKFNMSGVTTDAHAVVAAAATISTAAKHHAPFILGSLRYILPPYFICIFMVIYWGA